MEPLLPRSIVQESQVVLGAGLGDGLGDGLSGSGEGEGDSLQCIVKCRQSSMSLIQPAQPFAEESTAKALC